MAKRETEYTLSNVEQTLTDCGVSFTREAGARGTKLSYTDRTSFNNGTLGSIRLEAKHTLTFNTDGTLRSVDMSGKALYE